MNASVSMDWAFLTAAASSLSVTMAVGARKLARSSAVVSHLPAIEELGGMDVLCTDKTGTLTQNTLSVTDVWTATDVDRAMVLATASAASRAEAHPEGRGTDHRHREYCPYILFRGGV